MESFMNESIDKIDPELYDIIKREEVRQKRGLELIASENYTSIAVMQANSSCLTNKYSEGVIGARYYGGNENIDAMESLCKQRALLLFNLDPSIWDVNVQPLSGSTANLSVYVGLLPPGGKIMGLSLSHGGHLTHGHQTKTRKVSASSIFFTSQSYFCGKDHLIDYNALENQAKEFDPDLLICGGSAYSRDFDYVRLRNIAGEKYLMADISHISGFVATGLMKNAFDYCDVVTTTTHKLLRGPRSGMIFYRKVKFIAGNPINVKKQIDSAVFPGLHGGPHNHQIAALCTALKQASTFEYKTYCNQVLINAKHLAKELEKRGHSIVTGGTDCHLILMDVGSGNGSFIERTCELADIVINRNAISSDVSMFNPSGIRLGTPALTTRGFKEKEFTNVAEFLDTAILIAKDLAMKANGSKDEFEILVTSDSRVKSLKKQIALLIDDFPIPLFDFRIESSK